MKKLLLITLLSLNSVNVNAAAEVENQGRAGVARQIIEGHVPEVLYHPRTLITKDSWAAFIEGASSAARRAAIDPAFTAIASVTEFTAQSYRTFLRQVWPDILR